MKKQRPDIKIGRPGTIGAGRPLADATRDEMQRHTIKIGDTVYGMNTLCPTPVVITDESDDHWIGRSTDGRWPVISIAKSWFQHGWTADKSQWKKWRKTTGFSLPEGK